MLDITTLDSYQFQMKINHPFVVVIGPEGSGKKTQSRKVAESRGRQFIAIEGTKENIESLTAIADLSVPTTICIYDYSDMSKYAINALLKTAEETPENMDLVLCSRTNNILGTIRSRAQVVQMSLFSEEQLRQEYGDTISKMCITPGQACKLREELPHTHMKEGDLTSLFDKILQNIQKVSTSNALKLVDTLISDKDGYNLLPYLGRYGVRKDCDEPVFRMMAEALTIKESTEAYRWILRNKRHSPEL